MSAMSKKRDEIYRQYEQHIKAFDQDYRALLSAMEETDKSAAYYEEQFSIQSDYLWRAVDLVKEYQALLANMPMNLTEDDMVLLWIAKRDQLQERAVVLNIDLIGETKDAH